MKVFIISIEQAGSIRLNQFLQQPFFQSLTQQYKKIGIKGAELSAKFYFEKAVKGREQALTPGELGCTLSHLQALKEFLESDDSYAFILEDDAILPEDLTIDMLQQEFSRIKLPPKTLLSLGGIQMKESRKVRGKFVQDQFLGKKVLSVPMKNQYEQQCNALALENLGIPVIWRESEFLNKLKIWVKDESQKSFDFRNETKEIIDSIFRNSLL